MTRWQAAWPHCEPLLGAIPEKCHLASREIADALNCQFSTTTSTSSQCSIESSASCATFATPCPSSSSPVRHGVAAIELFQATAFNSRTRREVAANFRVRHRSRATTHGVYKDGSLIKNGLVAVYFRLRWILKIAVMAYQVMRKAFMRSLFSLGSKFGQLHNSLLHIQGCSVTISAVSTRQKIPAVRH